MLEVWHMWIIAGIVLWIVEIFTPGFVVGVFATACFIVAPFAGSGVSSSMQLLIFGITTGVMFFGIRPLILRYFYSSEAKIKTNVDALIGKSCIVSEAIDNVSDIGRVKIGGEIWRAITQDDSKVDIGQKVIIRKVEGCRVIVELINKNERTLS
ncbi:NfeD family protein [candidate division KSB1 bacterium]|nr:NfeD family protein [candidate division KSB1 bacterium]